MRRRCALGRGLPWEEVETTETTMHFSQSGIDRLHDQMAGYVERNEYPGIVTVLCRRDEVLVDLLGTKALGGNDRMRRDTIFRISSMSKPVVAVGAMILVEES